MKEKRCGELLPIRIAYCFTVDFKILSRNVQ